MYNILAISFPFLLSLTVIRAAISQGLKISAIMKGVEPQTDWFLIGISIVTMLVLAVLVVKCED